MTYVIRHREKPHLKYVSLRLTFKVAGGKSPLVKPVWKMHYDEKRVAKLREVVSADDKLGAFCEFCDWMEVEYSNSGLVFNNPWSWIKQSTIDLLAEWGDLIYSGTITVEWELIENLSLFS